VFWSLLAVPSLTILISNMGDTIIKWFSDLTIWIGSITVLPGEAGLRASIKGALREFLQWISDSYKTFTPPGILGSAPIEHDPRMQSTDYENKMLDRLAERLSKHVAEDEAHQTEDLEDSGDSLTRDIQFYHYVLARECRNVQKHLNVSPPKEYGWGEWEYFLKLMGNEDDPVDFPGQKQPDILVPEPMKAPEGLTSERSGSTYANAPQTSSSDDTDKVSAYETARSQQLDGNIDRRTSVAKHMSSKRQALRKRKLRNPDDDFWVSWSWLSNESPLMSRKCEAEWILERLSAALERELNRSRKGFKRKPPISLSDARKRSRGRQSSRDTANDAERIKEEESLERAERGEE
jgi:potassium channel subfamily K, other eukaryote